jgi:hypothetical protein
MDNLWDSFLSTGGADSEEPENLWDNFLPGRPRRNLSLLGADIAAVGGQQTVPLQRFNPNRQRRDMSRFGEDLREGGALGTIGVDPRAQTEEMYGKDESGAFKRHARSLGAGIVDLAAVLPAAAELGSDLNAAVVSRIPTLGIDALQGAKDRYLDGVRAYGGFASGLRSDMKEGADELAPESEGVVSDWKNRKGFLGKASAVSEAVTRGLPSTLALLATGGGTGAVMLGGAIAGLPEYSQAKADGTDKRSALLGAIGQGVVGGILERVGIEGVLGTKLPNAASYSLWRDIRNAALKEGLTESLQEANSYAWQRLQGREAGSLADRMMNSGIVGGFTGGALHGVTARLHASTETTERVASNREGGVSSDEDVANRRVADYDSTWRSAMDSYSAELEVETKKALERLPSQIKDADWLIEQQSAGNAYLPDELSKAQPAVLADARARERLRSQAHLPEGMETQAGRIEEVRRAVVQEAQRRVQAKWNKTFEHIARESGATLPGDMADATAEAATPQIVGPSKKPPTAPNEQVRQIAREYVSRNGNPAPDFEGKYASLDHDLGRRVADAYEGLRHDPANPEVSRAYQSFKNETLDQWQFLTGRGVKFEPWIAEGQPYVSSDHMIADVRDNGHLFFFTGGDMPADHPLAEKTGVEVGGLPLTYNDVFRAVHDYFGHAKEGYQFGPRGEENAYQTHAKMYSQEARRALTTETRGQNSWVNFGPQLRRPDGSLPVAGEPGFISPQSRPYAEQKAGLLPEEMGLLPEELSQRLQQVATEEDPSVAEGMSHGGSDVSPEAINRVARRERYLRITPGGQIIPIINDVAAVDVRVNPGEVKAVIGQDGRIRVEEGRPNGTQAKALMAMGADEHVPVHPLVDRSELTPETHEIEEPEIDDELASLLGGSYARNNLQAPRVQAPAASPEMASQAGAINTAMFNPANWKKNPAPAKVVYPNDQDIHDYASINNGKTFSEAIQNFGRHLYNQWFDREAPLVRIAKKVGDETLPRLISLSRGVADIARYPITRGTRIYDPNIGGYRYTGRGLKQIIGGADSETMKDLSRYMAAERQIELHDRRQSSETKYAADRVAYRAALDAVRQAKLNLQTKSPDRATRVARMQAYEQARANVPTRPSMAGAIDVNPDAVQRARETKQMIESRWGTRINELTGLAEDVRDWSKRAVIDPLREVGYLSKERYQAILDQNEKYAPFFRLVEELNGDLKPVNTTGKKNPVGKIHSDIDAGIINPLESMVLKAQQIQKWVDRQRIRNYLADLTDANGNVNEVEQVTQNGRPVKNGPLVLEKKDTFSVFRNGDRLTYRASGEVMSALESLNPGQADLVMKGLSFFASMRRAGATLGLGFILRNPLRDQQTAAVNSKYGYVPYLDLVKGMIAASPFAKRLSPHMADFYDEMHAVGALQGDMISADMKGAAYELQDLTRDKGPGQVYKDFRGFIRREGVLFPLHILSKQLELGTRVGAYVRAREGGATQMEAGVEARDITIDFRRMGNSAQKWNMIEAFSNAELQDIDIFRKRMTERPVATGLKLLAYVTLPAMINYAMNKDDEDYQQLQEWDKAMFYHPHKFSDGSFLRIPRPIGLMNVLFGYGAEKLLGHVNGKDPEAGKAFLNQVVEATPLHYLAGAGVDGYTPFNPKNYIDLIPTAFEPMAESAFNYDSFRDAPVIPEGEQDLLPEYQGQDTLGPSALALGKMTGTSPYVAKHMVEGTFATLGKQAMTLADKAMGQDQKVASDPLGVATFLGFRSARPIGFGSRPVSEFYKLEQQVSMAKSTMADLKKKGNAEAYLDVMQKNPGIAAESILSDTKKKLAKLRVARRQIMAAEGLTPQDRATLLLDIDTMATQVAGTTNMAVQDFLQAAENGYQ